VSVLGNFFVKKALQCYYSKHNETGVLLAIQTCQVGNSIPERCSWNLSVTLSPGVHCEVPKNGLKLGFVDIQLTVGNVHSGTGACHRIIVIIPIKKDIGQIRKEEKLLHGIFH